MNSVPRRLRPPRDIGRLIVMLAVILGTFACTASVVSVLALTRVTEAVQSIKDEAGRRRNANCISFERQARVAIIALNRNYAYLETLPAEEYGTNLTKAVVDGLPALRDEANAARAPSYCSDASKKRVTGLPDDFVPELPEERSFQHLLKPEG